MKLRILEKIIFGVICAMVISIIVESASSTVVLFDSGTEKIVPKVDASGQIVISPLSSGSSSMACTQSGAWTVAATQSGAWTNASTQSGDWSTRLLDGNGTIVTSQANGAQRALDVGVNVSGVQVDPRAIRALTASDIVGAAQSGSWTNACTQSGTWTVLAGQSGTWSVRNLDGSGNLLTSQVNGSARALDVGVNVAGVQVDPRSIRALTGSDVVSAAQSGTWSVRNLDGSGNSLTSQASGAQRALDVGIAVSGTQIDPRGGNVAHDAADSGNPFKIGGIAKNQDGTDPGSVAENDRTDARYDVAGRQFVNIGSPFYFKSSTNYTAAQTNTQLLAAPGVGLSYYITDVVYSVNIPSPAPTPVSNSASFKIVENTGSAATVFNTTYLGMTNVFGHTFQNPIKLTANVNLGVTTTINVASTAHSVTVTGFIAP